MPCASCANRIERKPNKLDGVTATVNYATAGGSTPAPLSDVDLVHELAGDIANRHSFWLGRMMGWLDVWRFDALFLR